MLVPNYIKEYINQSWESLFNDENMVIDNNINPEIEMNYILFIDKNWKPFVKMEGKRLQSLSIIPSMNQAVLMVLHDKFQGEEFNDTNREKYIDRYNELLASTEESMIDRQLLFQYLIMRLNDKIDSMLEDVRGKIESGELKGVNTRGKI